MLMLRDWASYRTWHELLDALCLAEGHLDNMALADQFCAASGNRTQVAFETAVKNLRNWRQGIHIPQRRNFLLLTKVLNVHQRDGLRAHWNAQYHLARRPLAAPTEQGVPPPRRPLMQHWRIATIAGVVVGAGLLVAGIVAALMPFAGADDGAFEWIGAGYSRTVTARVGDALIIHGARGNDCGPAPDWEVTRSLLPTLATGTLSDGGVGTRFSRQCDGRVAARAILFTATTPGTEQTAIYGEPVTINVQ
jgi:hypothetical protein